MKQRKGRHFATENRRRDIINAALACFSEIGFSETNMEDIRLRSGASTGSIYHHFRSKEQLAAEIYIEGIRTYQNDMVESLDACTNPREGIRAIIASHMAWIKDNAEWSRYLFQKRHSVFMDSAEEEIAALNRDFGQKLVRFFQEHMGTGAMKSLPYDVLASLIFGPCMEFTRHYLDGTSRTSTASAAKLLSAAVWQALDQGPQTHEARLSESRKIRR